MNFIDSHCHPQFPQYDQDREEVIKRTLDERVKVICVGTDLEMSKKAISLARKYDGILATVGIHPNDVIYDLGFKIYEYEKLLRDDKVVAIGEVGLDYYRTKGEKEQEKQREVFGEFIKLSVKHKKPLIIHCRDAYKDAIEILDTKYMIHNTIPGGVIHSFTGAWDVAQEFIKRGFYVGLNGIITFPPSSRRGGTTERQVPLQEVVEKIPLDKLLLETDAPYLAPVPRRGKRNEPWYVKFVARHISKLRGETVEEIAEKTTQNAKKLFNLIY